MEQIAISATNPCHLFHMARALHGMGKLGTYYSGYPEWKLPAADGMRVRSFPLRTLGVYGLLKYIPPRCRPKDHHLFQWQDKHFDESVANALEPARAVHGMPGQSVETFRAAKKLGIQTVLNHATGPSSAVTASLDEEYARVGMTLSNVTRFDELYRAQEEEEMALADFHCVASTIVAEQLTETGISSERIWRVPYGADASIFRPEQSLTERDSEPFRIVFAGQLTLRKGVRFLLEALTHAARTSWEVNFYGGASDETAADLASYEGETPIRLHGSVSQARLADAFQHADLLVLPSLEEGFGLVVAQALNCGLPCLVSSATGAKDLIRHRDNGSIVPPRDSASIAKELLWWSEHRHRVTETHSWETAAMQLADYHFPIPTFAHCA